MSSYFNTQDYIAQKRYLAKLNIDGCSLQDPYAIEETQWSEDMSKWPDMQWAIFEMTFHDVNFQNGRASVGKMYSEPSGWVAVRHE